MGDIAENTAVAKKGYELFMAVNIEGFMELIDDSCEWVTSGPQDKLSWVGSYQGRAGVGQFFGKLAEAIEITAFEPREFIAQGDRVVVLGSSTAINKATGKSASQVWAHATVIDGKIHAFRNLSTTLRHRRFLFTDSFLLLWKWRVG